MIKLFKKYQVIEPKQNLLIIDRFKRILLKKKINLILFSQFVAYEKKIDEQEIERALTLNKKSKH